MDLEKITAHALTHLLRHRQVHIDDLHKSIQDAHHLRDDEMPMVHSHLQNFLLNYWHQGWIAGPPGSPLGAPTPEQLASLSMVELNSDGREGALQFLEHHGYPPPN